MNEAVPAGDASSQEAELGFDGIRLPDASDALTCGPLWISPEEMCEVRVRGRRVPMSLRRLRILACLTDAGGKIVTRDELYERSGGGALRPGSRTIDVHVALIRRSLGSIGRYLIAVPERGYRIDVIGLESSR